MKASTERLIWIGGGATVLLGGIAALALSSKSTATTPKPAPPPPGGGQGGTLNGSGGLVLPRGIVINIIPPNGLILPAGGFILPNGQYTPAPSRPGQAPSPPRQISNYGADASGPFSFAMLPGDSLVIGVPTWAMTQDANPDVLIRTAGAPGYYSYIATDNVDMSPNGGKSTDILFTSGSGWNRQNHRFHVYVGVLA